MAADFTPIFTPYSGQGSFRFWSQKILPLVYDDSLSYYELLCKVVDFLNNVIHDMDTVEANTQVLLEAYNELQGYVNAYFDNLDVQEEINAKLDEMAESGALSDLLEPFIPDIITGWLNENVNPVGSAVIVDSSLSIPGAAADAKVTGDKFKKISGSYSDYATLTDGTDFDDVTEPGNYKITSSASMETMLNTPINTAGKLSVFNGATATVVYQVLYASDSKAPVWIRCKLPNAWQEWYKIASSNIEPYAMNSIHTKASLYTTISDNTDFDEITTAGEYKIASDASMQTMTNTPVTKAAKMSVFEGSNSTVKYQVLYVSDTGSPIWVRCKIPSGWQNWYKLASDEIGVYARHSMYNKSSLYETIPNNTDLNDITTAGEYKITTDASMQTMTNTPVTKAAKLSVFEGSSQSAIYQMLYVSDTGSPIWIRCKTSSGWYNWYRIANADVEELAEHSVYNHDAYYSVVANNTNFNDLTTPGNYKITSSANMQTMLNTPVSVASVIRVLRGATNTVVFQILTPSDNSNQIWYRIKMPSAWSAWEQVLTEKMSIIPENVSITGTNVSTYFPNGLMSDAELNTMYYIPNTKLFSDAPVGNTRIVHAVSEAEYLTGILITMSGYRNKTGVSNSKTQMFISYCGVNDSGTKRSVIPTFSYRTSVVINSAYVWSDWTKFEQDGYLHGGNQVIYGGSLDAGPFTDLDDAPMNSIYQLDLNLDGHAPEYTLGHHPEPGVSSVVMTYAYSYSNRHGMVQTLFNLQGRMYWRYGYWQNTTTYVWTSWKLINPNIPAIPNAPNSDGVYKLICTVSNGNKTYSWVSDT